ncbi:hypothetical protein ACFSQJ_12740 [Croceitalea marina]|uniref:Redox-active disulfide protein 2 n=1 Tax=Croceitalea marina TaxID=1775166 RepID=A0ABW5MZB0_9FLAO
MKGQKKETLTVKLNTTKRIMQIATFAIIVVFLIFIYQMVSQNESLDRTWFPILVGPLSIIVILLDKKYKKIKAELDSRA